MKSPNIMSTTGRNPVIAAPTASPVKPASEMGVSRTRSLPNSSTRPESTLKGVPASATSSPMMQTLASRRISSASASRIACAKVSSRSVAASGIDVLLYFVDTRVGRGDGEVHGLLHFRFQFVVPAIELDGVGEFLFDQPIPQIEDGIPLCLPGLLFLFRAIVFAVDIADMVAVVAVGAAEKKRRAPTVARAINQTLRDAVHCPDVLSIHAGRFHAKCLGAHQNVT